MDQYSEEERSWEDVELDSKQEEAVAAKIDSIIRKHALLEKTGATANILFVGENHVGKSSSINSTIRACTGGEVKGRLRTASGNRSKTSTTIKYEQHHIWLDKCLIRLCDTKGSPPQLSLDETPARIFQQILDGKYSPGRNMNEADWWFSLPRWNRKIHTVVFITTFENPPPAKGDDTKSLLKFVSMECAARGIPLHIFVTHADIPDDEIQRTFHHTRDDVIAYLSDCGFTSIHKITNYTPKTDLVVGPKAKRISTEIDNTILDAFISVVDTAIYTRQKMDKDPGCKIQ